MHTGISSIIPFRRAKKGKQRKRKNNHEKLNAHLLFLHFISWLLTTLIKFVYQYYTGYHYFKNIY